MSPAGGGCRGLDWILLTALNSLHLVYDWVNIYDIYKQTTIILPDEHPGIPHSELLDYHVKWGNFNINPFNIAIKITPDILKRSFHLDAKRPTLSLYSGPKDP